MRKLRFGNMIKKGTRLVALTTLFAVLAAQPALAATSIGSVSVKLNLELQDGDSLPSLDYGYTGEEEAEVTTSENNKYKILNAEWSKDVDEMEMGSTYKIKITLGALDDYEFKGSYSSSKVTVKGGSFVSARRNNDDELVVTVKTKAVEGVLEEPDDARWLSENYKNDKFAYAKWDSVDDAAYDVYLYRGEKLVHKVNGLKSTTYNFYPYMTRKGDYSFKVRAVPRTDDIAEYAAKSEWNFSDELYVAEDEVSDGTGQGVEETTNSSAPAEVEQVGWIASGNKWFFRYPDGTYLRDSWGKINGIWYLFDTNGEMLTGWHNRNGQYYYMNQDGAMQTGWLKENNAWYYLNPDGSMKTGWLVEGGKTYYLETSGAMATGWKNVDGLFYYFYPDGHKAVNEVISGFYVDYNGVWQRP